MESNDNQNDRQYSLDHLIIGVKATTLDEEHSADYALNQFITDNGRRTKKPVPNHYSYGKLHDKLVADHGLDKSHVIRVRGEETGAAAGFYDRLDRTGDGHEHLHPDYKLPYVEFYATRPPGEEDDFTWDDDDIFSSTPIGKRRLPQPEPENPQPAAPAPQPQPPVNPLNRRIRALQNPATPRRSQIQANPQTPANPQRDPQGSRDHDLSDSDNDNEPMDIDTSELQGVHDLSEGEEHSDEDEESMLESLAQVNRDSGNEGEDWKRVCEFFNCSQNVRKVKVKGIKLDLELYQAFAVWRIFKQIGHDKIPSFMVGDAPGLGKTGISITTAVIFALLQNKFVEVLKEWNDRGLQGPRKHLRRPTGNANSGVHDRCPSQGEGEILCPCSGLSYRVVNALLDLPTFICCPADVMEQWYKETEKWIDRSLASPAQGIKALVWAGTNGTREHPYFSLSPYYATIRHVDQQRKLTGRRGLSSTFIISSYQNAAAFRTQFLERITLDKKRGRKQNPEIYDRFGCGFMFFDEYHKYKGSRNNLTKPFENLRIIRDNCIKPVMAVGLSGSLCQGPEYWRPFINHALETGGTPKPIAGLQHINDLDKYENNFKYLVDNLDRDAIAQRGRGIDDRREVLGTFLTEFIPLMIIARKKTHRFRGVRIGPAATAIKMIQKDMLKGEVRKTVESMAKKVGSFIRQQAQREIDGWERNGEVGERPTQANLIRRMIMRDTVINSGEDEEGSGRREYDILTRASCFPYLAVLSRGEVAREEFLVGGFGPIANLVTNELHPRNLDNPDFDAVRGFFAQSPFYEHRQRLLAESPKMQWVQEYIDELLRIRKQPRNSDEINDQWGPPPPDDSNCRHAVLLADNPLSSFNIMMQLWERYEKQIREGEVIFLYGHSGVSLTARNEYTQYLNAKCNAGDKLKILVSTIDIYGVGHNLQRANTAIITEVPGSYAKVEQAAGRVDRKGSEMKRHLYLLYDGENLAEKTRWVRNQNRRRMASQGHQGDGDDAHKELFDELSTLADGAN